MKHRSSHIFVLLAKTRFAWYTAVEPAVSPEVARCKIRILPDIVTLVIGEAALQADSEYVDPSLRSG
jgi:hypothetical protein